MFSNSTILITGGGSGIGEALALQLAVNNKVIICGRSEEKLKNVSLKNKNISYEIADISDYNSIEKLFINVKAKGIVLNVLFNNAGVVELWDLSRTSFTAKEIFEKANTNFSGAVAVTQYFINQADKSVENLIINNTSEIAILPIPILPLYSASKSALSVFTKLLRVQLKNTKFKVIEVLSPGVDTDMPKRINNRGKLINVNDFAANVIKSIMKGTEEYTSGPNVSLMKFFKRVSPSTGINLLDKLSRKQLGLK